MNNFLVLAADRDIMRFDFDPVVAVSHNCINVDDEAVMAANKIVRKLFDKFIHGCVETNLFLLAVCINQNLSL